MLQQSEPVACLNGFAPSWFYTCCTHYLGQQSVVAVLVCLHFWVAFSQYACCSGHQKELLPIEIIKREGMHSAGQGMAMNISIPAPTPTLHPSSLSFTSNVLPSAGRTTHSIAWAKIYPLCPQFSHWQRHEQSLLCTMHCFIQSSYLVRPRSTCDLWGSENVAKPISSSLIKKSCHNRWQLLY